MKKKSSLWSSFPLVTVRDWVKTKNHAIYRLGIDVWFAVIGGSLGACKLQWSLDYADRLKKCVIIASAPKLSAQMLPLMKLPRQSFCLIPISIMDVIWKMTAIKTWLDSGIMVRSYYVFYLKKP